MGLLVRFTLLASILFLAGAPSSAQILRYSTDFPDATGWTFGGGFGAPYPRWSVDATPAFVQGTPSFNSPPASLNFNDGICFGFSNCAGTMEGTADSPPIDISAPSGAAALTFWCLWETEVFAACQFDSRKVQVGDVGMGILAEECFDDPVCGPQGIWHQHTMQLDPAWGLIRLRFNFDTVDGQYNDGAGWFVDDITITTDCAPPTSYCTAKVNSQGCTPRIESTGFPSPTHTSAFLIRATSVISGKPGLLLYSYASAATSFQGGFLCLTAPVSRIGVGSSSGGPPPPLCAGTYSYDFNDRVRSGVDPGLIPGKDVFAQYWQRDQASSFGIGLTDGLAFVICP
jgi:hypothetical protein